MKQILSALVIAAIVTSSLPFGLAHEASAASSQSGSFCPVSGDKADSQFTSEYKGKTYTFCCRSCVKKFKKDPEKYIHPHEMEAAEHEHDHEHEHEHEHEHAEEHSH